jgi:hypothetical protein
LFQQLESLIEVDKSAAGRLLDFVKERGKRGRGRPPLDTVSRKSVIITVRLTEEQRENLKKTAHQQGKGISEIARDLILAGIKIRQ